MIEHLVISGGGTLGFTEFGVLYKLYKEGYWKSENIKSIYGTSCGTIIGVALLLDIDMETLYDYVVNRPWEKTLPSSIDSFIDLIRYKGLLNDSVIRCILEYLLHYKNLNNEITLKEFYDFSKRELYLYTVDAYDLKTVELSHHSHPDLPLLKAIHMSSSVPLCIQPVWYKNTYYIDGGFNLNYPLKPCLDRNKDDRTILSIRTHPCEEKTMKPFTKDINFVDYYSHLFSRFINKFYCEEPIRIDNEVIIPYKSSDSSSIETMYNKETRDEWIEHGKKYAVLFLQYNIPKNHKNKQKSK